MLVNKTGIDCSVFGYDLEVPDNSSEINDLQEPFLRSISVAQLVICVFGTIGNFLTILVLATTKSMHTIPNLYIGMLAVIDLIICLLIPVSTVQMLIRSNSDTIPHLLCKAIGYVIVTNTTGSLFCMMLVAVNRYVLIVKGKALYVKIYTKKNSIASIVLVWVWIISVVVIVPEAGSIGFYGYNAKFGTCFVISYCFANYIYVSVVLMLTIFLPVTMVTGWAYFSIVRKLLEVRRKIKLHEQRPNIVSMQTVQRNEVEDCGARENENRDREARDNGAGDSGVEVSQTAEEDTQHMPAAGVVGAGLDSESHKMDDKFNLAAHKLCYQNKDRRESKESRKLSENFELLSPPSGAATPVKDTADSNSCHMLDEPKLQYIIRRLSPANMRVRVNTLSKLRKPQWSKLCSAICNMITIYVVLWACWFPMLLQYLTDMHGLQPAYAYKIEVTFLYLNSAFNVLLYAMMSSAHRKAYKEFFVKCLRM